MVNVKIVLGIPAFILYAVGTKLLGYIVGWYYLKRERQNMGSKPVMTTISFSHFCEKARFALDAVIGPSGYKEDGTHL
jgi:hypothetical protein